MRKTEDYSRELMTIFFAQKRTILSTTIIFTVLSLLIAFFWPPTYSAEGTVMMKGKKREKSPEALDVDTSKVSLIYELTKEDLAAEMSILSSLNVLEKAVKKLSSNQLFPGLDPSDPEALRMAVAELQEHLTLKLVPSSNLIEAHFQNRDAQAAVAILKQIFAEYLEQRFKIYNPGEVEIFYQEQALKSRAGILALEDQLMEVAQRAATPKPEFEIQNNLIIKKDIEQQLVLLKNKMVEKKSHVEAVEHALSSQQLQLFAYLPVPSINDMAEKVQGLLIKKASVLSLYRPQSQKGQQLEGEIETAFQALKDEVTAYLSDQRSQLEGLESQIELQVEKLATLTLRNVDLHRYQIENGRVERELELQKQSYKVFMQRWEETKINSTSEANNLFSINILSSPTTSGRPVFPRKELLIPIGILAGFISGCCFGFIRAYFDQTVKTPEDIHVYVDLPTIFSIPDWDASSR